MIGGYIGSPIGGIVVLAENRATANLTEADDTATGLILRGYFPISNRPITTRITKAQSTLPAHVTKQVSPATQITA